MQTREIVNQKVVKDTSIIWIDDDGFLRIQFINPYKKALDVNEAKKNTEVFIELCNGIPRYFLVDIRGAYGEITDGAKAYFSKHPVLKELRIAEAFVVTSLANRIIVHHYVKMFSLPCPTAIFSNMKKAKDWLRKQ